MIRVVPDTNIVVSACLNEDGLPFYFLKPALAGAVRMYVSEPVLAEYEELLKRQRFRARPAAPFERAEAAFSGSSSTRTASTAGSRMDNRQRATLPPGGAVQPVRLPGYGSACSALRNS